MPDSTLANVHAVCCPPHLAAHTASAASIGDDDEIRHILEATRTVEAYNQFHAGKDLLQAVPPKVQETIAVSEPVVYLTFDDGPYETADAHEASTRELMAVLSAKNSTATFFCQGFWSFQNEGLIRDLVSAGHNLGD